MTRKVYFALLALMLCVGNLAVDPIRSQGVVAQEGGAHCAAAFTQAVAATSAACTRVVPGMLCAGEGMVEVYGPDGEPLVADPTLALEDVDLIQTFGLQEGGMLPGISVLRVPGLAEGERLTAVLFGDASLSHDPGPPVGPACNAVSIGTVNIRQEPNTNSAILGQLMPGASAPILARLADSSWWRIRWEGREAWVFAQLAPADCDPQAMLVIDPASGVLSGGLPAPAFQGGRLQTSFVASSCPGAPRGGLLLQSESASASWRINGLSLAIEGTLLIQASPDDILAIQVIEGQAALTVGDIRRQATAGQMIRVPMSGGVAAGVPGPALDLLTADVASAPLALLPRPVTLLPIPESPAQDADATLSCPALTEHLWITPESGEARLPLTLRPGQAVRVSVSAASASGLAVQGPDGNRQTLISGSGAASVADYVAQQAGPYILIASGVSERVRFGVTCDLPQALPDITVRSCDDALLHWDGVAGGEVRFSAPTGAQVSAIVQHAVPSAGDAQRLEVLASADDGQLIAQTAFATVQNRRVAGPLDFSAPADGTYVLRWDGDPFTVAQVEVLCFPATPGGDAGEE